MIVVTAPTGLIGRQVVERLMEQGVSLRVIVRDAARLPSHVRERVEVIEGSHGDAVIVNRAFEGADAVFWLVPPDPRARSVEAAYVDFSRPACDALRRHDVKRVVGISAVGRGTPQAARAGYVTGSLAMDDLIVSSGTSYRAVTNPSFMDNIIRQVAPITEKGVFFSPIDGNRTMPTCATRDIASVSAQLLIDDTWSGVDRASVLGPANLSFNDMATIMSDVLGKPIRFQQIDFDAYKAQFLGFGLSDAMAQGMTDMAKAKNDGLDNAEVRTPANTTPTTFREWCERALVPAFRKVARFDIQDAAT
ncbi:MAG: NAD(P)H-binding protein [Gemmatimonadaceae bacterium]|nr:NAD(P)H-binding protein [Gemmatimonadaceae bacterium]